jgi:hypothetical protein
MGLQLGNVLSLRTLLPLNNLELYVITFLKALVTLGLDGAIVDEHIGPIIAADETKTLCVVKPFDFAFDSHVACSTGSGPPGKLAAQPSFLTFLDVATA